MDAKQALAYLEKYAISVTTGDETPRMRAAFEAVRSAVEDQEAIEQLRKWRIETHGSWLVGQEGETHYTCDLAAVGCSVVDMIAKTMTEAVRTALDAARTQGEEGRGDG